MFSFCRRGLSVCCSRRRRSSTCCPVPAGSSMVIRARSFSRLCFSFPFVVLVLAPRRRRSASRASASGNRNRVFGPYPPRLAHAVVKDLGAQGAVQPSEQRGLDVVEGALEALELLGGVLRVVSGLRERERKREEKMSCGGKEKQKGQNFPSTSTRKRKNEKKKLHFFLSFPPHLSLSHYLVVHEQPVVEVERVVRHVVDQR